MTACKKRWIIVAVVAAMVIAAAIGIGIGMADGDTPNVPSNGTSSTIHSSSTTTHTTQISGSSNGANHTSSSADGSSASNESQSGSSSANTTDTGTSASNTASNTVSSTKSTTTQTGSSSASGSGSGSATASGSSSTVSTSTTDGTSASSNSSNISTKPTSTATDSSTVSGTSTTNTTTTTSRPTSVTLPTQQDPETGDVGITFPCAVPGYDLVIEKLAPYKGLFVEDGSNRQVEEVAMILLHNVGDQPLEFAQIVVQYDGEELLFEASALPAGERAVVQEKTGKSVPSGTPKSSSALVAHRASMEMSSDRVRVKDNGNNTLTIQNLTNESISSVRVFYKYYIEDQQVFVGGIAFSMRLTRLGAGASVTVQPAHYTSKSGRVVMVLTYEE